MCVGLFQTARGLARDDDSPGEKMRMFFYGVLFVLFCSGVGRAEAIDYFQNFPGSGTSGSVSLSSYNWYGYYGNASLDAQQATASTTPGAQVSNGGNAANSSQPNVNAATGGFATYTRGVAFFNTTITTDQYVLGTGEYPIARNGGTTDPADFTWEAAGNAGDTQRLAIELTNNQWYVSTNVLTIATSIPSGSASNFATYQEQDFTTFNTAAASWQLLNFSTTGTSTLSIGSTLTSSLPSFDIAQFGVYMTDANSGTDHNFIDNFEVDSTPEPTMGLLVLGPLALLRRRRR
jgi:MYXO-CTERM domain-containing protein